MLPEHFLLTYHFASIEHFGPLSVGVLLPPACRVRVLECLIA